MINKTLAMSHAVKLAGEPPVWAAKICKNIGGEYEWLNSKGWRPVIRADDKASEFNYTYNYDHYVPASFGSVSPLFFDVEGVNNKNSTLVDSEIHSETKMKLTPVTSSNIKAVGHKDGVLYVEFKGGKTFSYDDVSETTYNEFIKSNSVGSFFARNIRKNYKGVEVKPNE